METNLLEFVGNGKIHRTPTPQGIRKIKVIRLEAFFSLKALFNKCKCFNSKERRPYHSRSVKVRKNEPDIATQNYVNEYEPSNAINVYDSSPWQWRRVTEWHRYINDPYENNSGHIVA